MGKVAFVVQRYGLEVNGGAEFLCRWVAELMNDVWDVQVLTTCALDYMTWANHYPEGEDRINGVAIHRFSVDKPRDVLEFNRLCDHIFWNAHTHQEEIDWMKAQGPNCPRLIRFIKTNKDRFDLFFFFTYLYGTTFWGLPLVAEKAFLIPTAHDEPPNYLSIFKDLFRKTKGFIFNTPEEKDFLVREFAIDCRYSDVVGMGVEFDPSCLSNNESDHRCPSNYVLYAGRIDESKGCRELFGFWEKYKIGAKNDLSLVLIGRSQIDIPQRKDVVHLGFVSDEDKFRVMSKAKCLIMPSLFESLSIVIMESWLSGRPVIVNGKCDVLTGQCRRSNGGLWYENYDEFEACLNFILSDESISRRMAEKGSEYTRDNYDSLQIKNKYLSLSSRFLSKNRADK